jgi:DNA-binding IclR family transcriptional regulator
MSSETPDAAGGLTVIHRTVRILEELQRRGGAGVTELADELDLPKSTVHTHLQSWAEAGYLSRDGDRYTLGLAFLRFAGYMVSEHPIVAADQTAIDELAMETDERVQVVDEHDGKGVYVYQTQGSRALPTDTHVGSRVHMHCTASGKAILAFLPASRRERIIETHGLPGRTPNTITERAVLEEELARIREEEVAFDDEERFEGVRCVAAPVLDEGRPYGALTISASKRHLGDEKFRSEYPDLVLDTAKSIQLQATYA